MRPIHWKVKSILKVLENDGKISCPPIYKFPSYKSVTVPNICTTVQTMNDLRNIKDPICGHMIFVTDSITMYIFINEHWLTVQGAQGLGNNYQKVQYKSL
jgi:hypothetical protein